MKTRRRREEVERGTRNREESKGRRKHKEKYEEEGSLAFAKMLKRGNKV